MILIAVHFTPWHVEQFMYQNPASCELLYDMVESRLLYSGITKNDFILKHKKRSIFMIDVMDEKLKDYDELTIEPRARVYSSIIGNHKVYLR